MTAMDAANWMAEQVKEGWLYQEQAAFAIQDRFGEQFVYYNENGNMAIGKDVLAAFNKLTKDTVVWIRSERCWRKREPGDPPGRQVSY